MLWASIILPITPSVLLAVQIKIGLSPSRSAANVLQTSKERIGGCVGTCQRNSQPSEHRRKERIKDARLCKRQPQRRVHATVSSHIRNRQHQCDCQQRIPHLHNRPQQDLSAKRTGATPIQIADNTAAVKIDVPVAESQLNLNSATSGSASTETSVFRCTCRSSPGHRELHRCVVIKK